MEVVDGVGRMTVVQGLSTGRECVIEVVLLVTGAGEEVDVVGSGVKVTAGEVRVPDSSTVF
jgi:predicted PhzF superfamily epimerase YddE/YHI9